MYVTWVEVAVKPASVEAFIAACEANHLASIQEPGNRRFDILQDAQNPSQFRLYEAYQSEADAKAHKDTPHYLIWRETVADMMVAPRQGHQYNALFPR
jgi:autoinducer 2-degrading protein